MGQFEGSGTSLLARLDGARLWSIVTTWISPRRGTERGGTHRTIGIPRSRARDAARGRPESDATVAAGGGMGKRRVGKEARSGRDFWRGAADPSERGRGDTRGDARAGFESHLLISEQRAGRFWTSARARAPPRSGSRGPQPRASGPATGPRSTPHPGASMFASASADEPPARLGSRRRDARRATRRRCHRPRRVTPSIPCERPRSLAWVWYPRRPGGRVRAGKEPHWSRAGIGERMASRSDYRMLVLLPGQTPVPRGDPTKPRQPRAGPDEWTPRPGPRPRSPAADLRPPAARQPTTRRGDDERRKETLGPIRTHSPSEHVATPRPG